ncbi:uncharacterized protein LOC122503494 [Leptopilina heterotoma]|uniref:uncharacterized protein LOC122503494 n=1 Tax=Leptopilina heterotoma TaxID=63436 RepID=UPI001CA8262F|nr:uncharacterized protein LOC122503494 [Leptopilina heterotoma]
MPKINYRWKGRIVSKKMYEKKKKWSENLGKKMPKKSSNLVGKEKSEVMLEQEQKFDECIIKQEIQPKLKIEVNQETDQQPTQSTEFILIKQEECCQEEENENSLAETEEKQVEPDYLNGRRIVELKFLAKKMWCCSCKEALSFQFIETEVRRGFGSTLRIRCHKCSIRNIVTTGEEYSLDQRRNTSRFKINGEVVKGAHESGIKYTNLKKFFRHLNIPCLDASSFKKYRNELKISELK